MGHRRSDFDAPRLGRWSTRREPDGPRREVDAPTSCLNDAGSSARRAGGASGHAQPPFHISAGRADAQGSALRPVASDRISRRFSSGQFGATNLRLSALIQSCSTGADNGPELISRRSRSGSSTGPCSGSQVGTRPQRKIRAAEARASGAKLPPSADDGAGSGPPDWARSRMVGVRETDDAVASCTGDDVAVAKRQDATAAR